jgi:hypothetical protein
MATGITDSYKNSLKSIIILLELVIQSWYFIQCLYISIFPLTINLNGDPHETI